VTKSNQRLNEGLTFVNRSLKANKLILSAGMALCNARMSVRSSKQAV
jgi:hypothetical protein